MVKITYGPAADAGHYFSDVAFGRQPNSSSHSLVGKKQTSIDQLLCEKVESLSAILQDIDRKITERHAVSSSVTGLIYQHYLYVKTKLFEMDQWPMDGAKAIELRRSNLEGTLDTLLNEKRREQVQCWQDIADLKREFWKWFKQYCDVAQRVRLVLSDGKTQHSLDNRMRR